MGCANGKQTAEGSTVTRLNEDRSPTGKLENKNKKGKGDNQSFASTMIANAPNHVEMQESKKQDIRLVRASSFQKSLQSSACDLLTNIKNVEMSADGKQITVKVNKGKNLQVKVVKSDDNSFELKDLPQSIIEELMYTFTARDIQEAPDFCIALLARKFAASKRTLSSFLQVKQKPTGALKKDNPSNAFKLLKSLGKVHGVSNLHLAKSK